MAHPIQIIVGPPGCGKTTRLMEIMEEEMSKGVYPEEIAFCSFTKKAANEAIDRAVKRFRLPKGDFPYIKTLHSLAYGLVGARRDEIMQPEHYQELGEILGISFSTKEDFEDGLPNQKFTGDQYNYLDGFARVRNLAPATAWRYLGDYDLNWFEFERYSRALIAYKEDRGLMDFTDLLCKEIEPINIKVAIIDEAQDLSTIQWEFALKAFANAERIYIAGDDDQAIYAWSGADVRYFLEMPGDRTILHQSHRVPIAIHKTAEEIGHRIQRRMEKVYNPTPERGLVDWHSDIASVDLSEGSWLILARNGYLLNQLAFSVRQQGLLYSFRGQSVINKKHLKAIQTWERYRKGEVMTFEEVAIITSYLPKGIKEWPTTIWHEALDKISRSDKEFYISLLRKGEKITVKPRININTIHGVKGGEADNVLLLTDISWKTKEAMMTNPDAEHRVWYVGVTRAKNSLHIIAPQTTNFYDI